MNWIKILKYDLVIGITKKHLFPLVQFMGMCVIFWLGRSDSGSDMFGADYFFLIFEGIKPLKSVQEFIVPIIWLQIMSCPLYLGLYYLISDIQHFGKQVLVHGGSRRKWFFSKCCWNMVCSLLYFLSTTVSVLFILCLTNKNVTISNINYLMTHLGKISNQISSRDVVLVTLIAPFMTIAAFNMMQMVLCLFIKPIYSFVICMSMLVIAVYIPASVVLGNGAMVVRSNMIGLSDPAVATLGTIFFATAILIASVVVGTIGFERFDILSLDE